MDVVLCKWDAVIAERLLELKHGVYLILDQFDVSTYRIPTDGFKAVYKIPDFNSLEQLGEVASELLYTGVNPAVIISHAEFSQIGAGFLADVLEIGNFSLRGALATRDKRLMKHAARSAGLRTANVVSLAGQDQGSRVSLAARTLGFPMVVKPSNGFGTFNTSKVHSEVELGRTLEGFNSGLGKGIHPLLRTSQWIAEEFISGDEYNANALILKGRIEFLSVIRDYCPRIEAVDRTKLNGGYVVEEAQNQGVYVWAKEALEALSQVIGLESGVLHMEFFDHRGEYVFSEVASRVGGGGVDLLISNRYGRSMRTMLVDGLCEGRFDRTAMRVPDGRIYGEFNVLPDRSGRVVAIPTVQELKAHPYVVDARVFRKVGDKFVMPDHPSGWCVLICYAIPEGRDLETEIRAIRDQFPIRCEADA